MNIMDTFLIKIAKLRDTILYHTEGATHRPTYKQLVKTYFAWINDNLTYRQITCLITQKWGKPLYVGGLDLMGIGLKMTLDLDLNSSLNLRTSPFMVKIFLQI